MTILQRCSEILRAGLILTSILDNVTPPFAGSLITWIFTNYNPMYLNYWNGEQFSAGALVYGSAEAGAGFGIGDDDDVLLGVGVGAGISGSAQIMTKLIFSRDEQGSGISFSGTIDLSAGAQAGAVGSKVTAGLQGNIAGEYELILYHQGTNLNRAEICFPETKTGV